MAQEDDDYLAQVYGGKGDAPDPYAPPPPSPVAAPPAAPDYWSTWKRAGSEIASGDFGGAAGAVLHAAQQAYRRAPEEVRTPTEAATGLVHGLAFPAELADTAFSKGLGAAADSVIEPTQKEYEKAYDPSLPWYSRAAHAVAGTVPILGPALAESSEVKPAYEGEPMHLQVERAAVGWIAGLLGGKELGEKLGGAATARGRQVGREIQQKAGLASPPIAPEAEILKARPEAVPTEALQAVEQAARQEVASGGKLAPETTQALISAREELGRRGAPLDHDPVAPEEVAPALEKLGRDQEAIRGSNPAEAAKTLESAGMKLAEAPAEETSKLGSAEWDQAAEKLGAPPEVSEGAEPSLEELASREAQALPDRELAPEHKAAAAAEARTMISAAGDEPVILPYDTLVEHLESRYGADAPEMAHRIINTVADIYDGRDYQQAQYDSVPAPADLQHRPPAATRGGVRQWVALFDKEGREITGKPTTRDLAGARVVSWAENPQTGELVPAGGITNLRGEQHYLTHTRSLGLHDLPTDFRPIRAAADALGWKEAEESTSSSMAKETYKKYIDERGQTNELSVAPHAGEESPAAPPSWVPPIGDTNRGAGLGDAGIGEGTRGVTGPPGAGGFGEAGGTQIGEPGAATGEFRASNPAAASSLAGTEPPAAGVTEGATALQTRGAEPPGPPAGPLPGEPATGGPEIPSYKAPELKRSLTDTILDSAKEAMLQTGITPDRVRWPRIQDQIVEQIASGELPAPRVVAAAAAHGISPEQLLQEFAGNGTYAAQVLNKRSQLARAFGGDDAPGSTHDVLNRASDLNGYGASGWNWIYEMATKNTRSAVKALFSSSATIWHMTGGGLIRTGIGGLVESVEYAIQKARGVEPAPGLGARPLEALRIVGNSLAGLAGTDAFSSKAAGGGVSLTPESWRAAARQARRNVELALSAVPVKQADRLYLQAANKVTASPGATGLARVVEKGTASLENLTTNLLSLHRAIDGVNTVAVMSAKLDSELAAAGKGSLSQAGAAHQSLIKRLTQEYGPDWAQNDAVYRGEFQKSPLNLKNVISPEMMERSVGQTIETMSRERPDADKGQFEKAAHGVLVAINNSPALAVIPVPGLTYSVGHFLWDHSFAVMDVLSSAERVRIAAGDTRAISKAVVGTTLAVSAIAAVQQLGTGSGKTDQWYKLALPGGGGRTLDIRPAAHIAALFYVAHLLNKAKGPSRSWADFASGLKGESNQLYKVPPLEEITKVVLNANLRAGAGLALVDDFFASLSPAADESAPQATGQAAQRVAGSIASMFLTPLTPLVDLYAQYDNYARDSKVEPFFGPILQKIPGGKEALPPAYSGLREGPPEPPAPLLHTIGGLAIDEPPNLLELEISKYQLTPAQVFPRHTGAPQADNLVRKAMGQVVAESLLPALQDEPYRSLPDAAKGLVLTELLSAVRKKALAIAASDNPEVFRKLLQKKPGNIWVRMLLKQKEQEEAAGAAPPPTEDGGPPQAEEDLSAPPAPPEA